MGAEIDQNVLFSRAGLIWSQSYLNQAMISFGSVFPDYGLHKMVCHVLESLGYNCGIEMAHHVSDTVWILHFDTAQAAANAKGRKIEVDDESVFVRSAPSYRPLPAIQGSTQDVGSSPRIFFADFQNGLPALDRDKMLWEIAARFSKLQFSLQEQRRPSTNRRLRTTTTHVKWILAFDKAPGIEKFYLSASLEVANQDRHRIDLCWRALVESKSGLCIVCRGQHASAACPELHHFSHPKGVRLEQYVPGVR